MLAAIVCAAALAGDPAAPLRSTAPEPPPVVGEIVFEGAPAESVRSLVEVPLNAPLDPRDVRDAVLALHASARFSRVAAYLEPIEPGRVRLVFVLTIVQKLVAVTFPGHQALAESILHQTANFQVNAEFQPDQVQPAVEAVQAAYYRIGYRAARIVPKQHAAPGGIALEMQIEEGTATRIAQLRFEGDLRLDDDELAAAFRMGEGDVLNLGSVEEGLRSVRDRYHKAGRLRARVEPARIEELRPGLARLVVPVEAGPLVRFHLRGNRAFADGVLASKLGGDPDEPLDAQAAQEMAARLRRFYVNAGFLRVRVAERELTARDGAEEIVFTIDEGPQVRVEKVIFTGNQGVPTAQLRERLLLLLRDNVPRDPASGADPGSVDRLGVMGRLRKPGPVRTRVDPDAVFDPVLYARALKQIEDLYKSQGYLSVRAGPPRLDPIGGDPEHLQVTVPIHEGVQTVVSRVVVEGGGDVPAPELDAAIVLRPGRPFSYLQAEEGRAGLTQIFTHRGHLYARVEDEEEFADSPEGATEARVEVRYRIQPGPVVKVAHVEVVGQRRTVEALVLDLVGLRPGDVLTPEVMDKGQQTLLRTGLFFSATLTPRNPEVPEDEKTVQVQLRERPTRDFQASVGFSLADGPRASAQWTQGNLLGRNLTFTAALKADFPFGRFPQVPVGSCGPNPPCEFRIAYPDDPIERAVDLGLQAPRLWPLTDKVRAGFDLIHQRTIQPSFDLTKYSAQISLDSTSRYPLSAGLAYEVGYQKINRGQLSLEALANLANRTLNRLPPGTMIFGSLRPSLIADFRDDPARPRSGLLAQVIADYLRSFTSTEAEIASLENATPASKVVHVNLVRVQGLLAAYLPLPYLSSLVFSVRGGRVFQLDSRSLTPGDRRFYLGGATSLRGFHEEQAQPQDLIAFFHHQVRACEATLTNVACTLATSLLAAGGTSDGGDQLVSGTAELRIPISQSFELGLFYDAGNLWVTPTNILHDLVLREAAGSGLRWLTPIGRMAIDVGFNLHPDRELGEPVWGFYFSLDPV